MANTEPTTHPPHVERWENPETAPKIEKLPYVTWFGNSCCHVMHALNELPLEARGTLIKDMTDFLRRQGHDISRRERAKAKRVRP
jgi:hypothetical protein